MAPHGSAAASAVPSSPVATSNRDTAASGAAAATGARRGASARIHVSRRSAKLEGAAAAPASAAAAASATAVATRHRVLSFSFEGSQSRGGGGRWGRYPAGGRGNGVRRRGEVADCRRLSETPLVAAFQRLGGCDRTRVGGRWGRRLAWSFSSLPSVAHQRWSVFSSPDVLSDRHHLPSLRTESQGREWCARERGGSRRGLAVVAAAAVAEAPADVELLLQDNVGPNELVLEAQARVCTGPTQTRPLDEDSTLAVLNVILQSVSGELPPHKRASRAQMGAYFGAMTLRATAFPLKTQWSEGERRAMEAMWPRLRQELPPDVLFLADPEGALFGGLSPAGPRFRGSPEGGVEEGRLVTALREVLAGGHIGFEETIGVLRAILPITPDRLSSSSSSLSSSSSSSSWSAELDAVRPIVGDALIAAYLICQRMNRESDRELKAYCFAFDQELGPAPVADVASLTHYGEPYDGSNRFFRPTLFVAAVRASYGESCLLHGVPWMPPKCGVTEEQQLRLLGANTSLDPAQAAQLLQDPSVGFAYLSQRECNPSLFSLAGMRLHIKKRPTFATTEKVQRFIHARGREAMMAGFYHEGYEEPLLMLMRRQPVEAGLVIKGEEGSLALMTRPQGADAKVKGRAVNYCAGFRPARSDPAAAAAAAAKFLRSGGSSDSSSSDSDGEGAGERLRIAAGQWQRLQQEEEQFRGPFHRETFALEVDAQAVGFDPTPTPRIERSAEKNLALGMEALSGQRGAAYDRIVFNAAVADHLLGCRGAEDLTCAVERAKDAIYSGRALSALLKYVEDSGKFE